MHMYNLHDCIYVDICICMRIYTYMHIYTSIYTYIYIYLHIYAYICIHIHIHIHIDIAPLRIGNWLVLALGSHHSAIERGVVQFDGPQPRSTALLGELSHPPGH